VLESFTSDVWVADGGIVSFHGFDYPTRMVIVRLADGGLWLWSPIQKNAEIEDAVRALGPVRHIVSPNKLHYLFLGEWQAAFPTAKMWDTASTTPPILSLVPMVMIHPEAEIVPWRFRLNRGVDSDSSISRASDGGSESIWPITFAYGCETGAQQSARKQSRWS
jgi:hypothetical protein